MFYEAWIPRIKTGTYTDFRLYDLVDDPAQQHDLSAQQPAVLARLKESLLQINASVMADGPDWHLK
jgi:arylsulfatase A